MINLRVSRSYKSMVREDELKMAVAKTVEFQGIKPDDVDVSIIIQSDRKLRELNRNFLGIDAATDVLSFALDETDPESGRLYLGDVIISFPRAQAQSDQAGHSVMDELKLLAVHGILHLLGYDHAVPVTKEKMWKAQLEILDSIQVVVKKWPED
jgi:probable rRNA maturation factor